MDPLYCYCSLYSFFFIVLSLVIPIYPILFTSAVSCHELGTEMEQRFIYSCGGKVTAHKYCPCWGHRAGCSGVLLSPSPNTWSPHLGLDRSLILTQSHTNIGQHNGAMDLPPDLNVEKLAAEMAGNTMMDEKKVNDQTYQQIVAFLKTEKVNAFRYRYRYRLREGVNEKKNCDILHLKI